MKSKASNIPPPSAERKVSAIVGKGARAKSRKGIKTTPAVVALPVLHEPNDDDDEIFDAPPRKRTTAKKIAQVKDVHTGQVQVQKPSKDKDSNFRLSRAKKAVHGENAWVSFQSVGDSQRKEKDTDHIGSSPQSANSSSPDSVQPPPKVSLRRKSRRRDTDSTVPSDFEESTSNPESAEELTKESPFLASHAIVLAHFQKILAKHPRILAAAAIFILLLTGFLFGRLQSGSSAEEEELTLAKPTPQLVKELNEALALIESGESSEALQKIQSLSAKHPDVSSLDYLAALTAMQAGDLKTAQERASLSVSKNQKVSDSLVLLSMTESGAGTGGKSSLRDPKIVRESLLREAVNADIANPFPMIELASFLRGQKRDEEALDLLRAANARLHPIDTHVVVRTSIQLIKLQQMPDEQLPAASSEGSITEIFSSVYISLRKKDYNQAAIALEKGRQQAAPDLFAYLINDPVFKPFLSEPVMTRAL
jgi:tetratricopeptide (TPR) repeat protein